MQIKSNVWSILLLFLMPNILCASITYVNPQPGENLHGLTVRIGTEVDIIASKVCIIESLVDALDIMISGSLGAEEILSAIEALSVEVSVDNQLICSKLEVIDSKIDEIVIESDASQLDVIESKIDNLSVEVSVDNQLICSKLEVIDSKIDEIVIESDASQLDVIESKIDNLSVEVSVDNQLICSKLEVIDSKIDEIVVESDASQLDVIESKIDNLSVEVSIDNQLICSKLEVIDSKIDEIVIESDASQLDVIESKIDVIDNDLSIDNELICSKLLVIESKVDLLACPTMITQADIPYTITVAGTYCLGEDVANASGSYAITISSDDVVLDLHEYTITGNASSGIHIIVIDDTIDNVTIKNGFLRDATDSLSFGIFAGESTGCSNVKISNVHMHNTVGGGIWAFEIDGLIIEGCTVTDSPDGTGIQLSGSGGNVYIADCTIKNVGGNGISSSLETGNIVIERCVAQEVSLAGFLISTPNASGTNVTNVVIRDCNALACTPGFRIIRIDDISLINCTAQRCFRGFWIEPSSVAPASGLTCINCQAQSCDRGAFILQESSGSGIYNDLIFKNCQASGSILGSGQGEGFLIAPNGSATNVQIIDCESENNAQHGIRIGTDVSEIMINNCSIAGNGADGVNYAGVSAEIKNSSIAYNAGTGIEHVGSGSLELCNNLVHNNTVENFSGLDAIDTNLCTGQMEIITQVDIIDSKIDVLAECCECDVIIMQSDIPYSIEAPGVYCLGEDIDASAGNVGIGIISTDNVVLDLRGHTIDGGGTTNNAIQVLSSDNIVVQNGRIVRTDVDAIAVSSSSRVIIRDMQINNVTSDGISIGGNDCTVERCEITLFTATGINITAGAERAVIEDCIIRNGVRGIQSSTTSPNCTINNCECSGVTTAGFDIRGANNVVNDCVASGNTIAAGVGFDISGANCQVKNSSAVGNNVGIDLNGVTTIHLCNNIVNGNTADFTGGAYDSDLCDDISVFDVALEAIESKVDIILSTSCPHIIAQLPYTITAAGTYCLAQDLTNNSVSSAITINTSNVTLDLNGYTINANGRSAIAFELQSNIVIRNGIIRDGVRSINATDTVTNIHISDIQIFDDTNDVVVLLVAGALIENVAVYNSTGSAFAINGSDVQVVDCTVIGGAANGFRISEMSRISLYRCEAVSLSDSGFSLAAVTDAVLVDCVAKECGDEGFFLTNLTEGCTLESCVAQNCTGSGFRTGPSFSPAIGVQMINCVSSYNGASGIRMDDGSSSIVLSGCIVNDNTSNGITVGASTSNMALRNCTTNNNGADGISVNGATGIIIRDCTAYGNGSDGFSTSAIEPLIQGNQAVNNGAFGFIDTNSTTARYWNNSTLGNTSGAYSGVAINNQLAGASITDTIGHYWINISN
ncbi:MAG TPA: right-handed parallel beta-helix repeat-containing protein [Candidatus Dependentiae bacterium]|nr:right-handed parallel beta-helix repeat-containing protein [Candidatus Dependentiae bacterium]HRQ62264.1 right-handed parallel beta-helix repeat-containing protein [Candidatus Dependentiae bacterium]